MTKSQIEEIHFHTFFESCPEEVIEKVRANVRDLTKYSKKSLEWIEQEANDYEDVFYHNADECDGNGKEVSKWKSLARSMSNLGSKCYTLKLAYATR